MNALVSFWINILNFRDRTDRKTFFISMTIYNLIFWPCVFLYAINDLSENAITAVLGAIFGIIFVIAFLAITTRRLHDVGNYSSAAMFYWWPLIGQILIIITCLKKSAVDSPYIDRPYV